MKNIAFIHNAFPAGGAERVTSMVGAALARTGRYRVTVFCQHIYPEDMTEDDRTLLNVVKIEGQGILWRKKSNLQTAAAALREHGIEIAVMTVEPVRYIEELRKELPLCRFLFHCHGMPLWEVEAKMTSYRHAAGESPYKWLKYHAVKAPAERIFRKYTRHATARLGMAYRNTEKFVVLCEGYRKTFEKLLKTGEDSHIVAMYNPVEAERWREAASCSKNKEVVYVGRLSYYDKRVDRLIRIWAKIERQFPDWKLRIVGSGQEEDNLKSQAAALGLGSIEFCGFSQRPEDYFRTASISCLTSAMEGWGLVLVEAQASGVWPIAFGVSDGVREILGTDGRFGTVVTPFDEDEFAGKLAELMARHDELGPARPRLARHAERYSLENVAESWDRLLSSI